VVSLSALGSPDWVYLYGGPGNDEDIVSSIDYGSDGNIYAAGYSVGSGTERDFIVISLAPERYDASVVSITAPPDTVFVNTNQNVAGIVQNLGNLPATFDVVATIDGYADTIQVSGLAPDSSTERTFADWLVPPADSTTYSMTVCAYLPGDGDSTNDCVQKTIFAYDPTGIEERHSSLNTQGPAFALLQNEPNPFSGKTTVTYSLPTRGYVILDVFNVSGRLVETLANETKEPGIHRASWDANGRAAGVYFYKLRAGDFESTRKMVVID
jgi:hypothetical protein